MTPRSLRWFVALSLVMGRSLAQVRAADWPRNIPVAVLEKPVPLVEPQQPVTLGRPMPVERAPVIRAQMAEGPMLPLDGPPPVGPPDAGLLAPPLAGAPFAVSPPPPPPMAQPLNSCPPAQRFWIDGEYLLWWIKGQQVPPLVTTGPVNVVGPFGFPGVLGQPGTAVLVGGDQNPGPLSGGRLTAGAWLDDRQTFGLEGSYFFLGEQSATRAVASTANGTPPLSFPFFNVQRQREDSMAIAFPGNAANPPSSGTASLTTSTWLQGGELNALFQPVNLAGWRVDLLGGFRWLELSEDLHFNTTTRAVPPGNFVLITSDRFATRNDFYGGQLGLRGEYHLGNFFILAAGKVAVGDMHQVVRISGDLLTNQFTGTTRLQAFPGSYLTQLTNLGTYPRDRFGVIPELNLTVGYQVTPWVRVFAGYSLLYLNSVLRPADQIDTAINPTRTAVANFQQVPVVGPPRPVFLDRESSFWAHGVNLGVEFRF